MDGAAGDAKKPAEAAAGAQKAAVDGTPEPAINAEIKRLGHEEKTLRDKIRASASARAHARSNDPPLMANGHLPCAGACRAVLLLEFGALVPRELLPKDSVSDEQGAGAGATASAGGKHASLSHGRVKSSLPSDTARGVHARSDSMLSREQSGAPARLFALLLTTIEKAMTEGACLCETQRAC